ncbi:hypothetical protein D3C81_2043660 [compost metagenome]
MLQADQRGCAGGRLRGTDRQGKPASRRQRYYGYQLQLAAAFCDASRGRTSCGAGDQLSYSRFAYAAAPGPRSDRGSSPEDGEGVDRS